MNAKGFKNHLEYSDTLHLKSKPAAYGGFIKLADKWLNEHSASLLHLWWIDSFERRNCQLLKLANR